MLRFSVDSMGFGDLGMFWLSRFGSGNVPKCRSEVVLGKKWNAKFCAKHVCVYEDPFLIGLFDSVPITLP